MVALSVSISHIRSPGATLSPTFTLKVAMLPWVMVGESAGMVSSVCEGSDDMRRAPDATSPLCLL
jgi:hypothetical protein